MGPVDVCLLEVMIHAHGMNETNSGGLEAVGTSGWPDALDLAAIVSGGLETGLIIVGCLYLLNERCYRP